MKDEFQYDTVLTVYYDHFYDKLHRNNCWSSRHRTAWSLSCPPEKSHTLKKGRFLVSLGTITSCDGKLFCLQLTAVKTILISFFLQYITIQITQDWIEAKLF